MGMGESVYRAVGIVISRAGIPPVYTGIGTGLYHSVGDDGAGECVPMASRSYVSVRLEQLEKSSNPKPIHSVVRFMSFVYM